MDVKISLQKLFFKTLTKSSYFSGAFQNQVVAISLYGKCVVYTP